MMSMNSNIDTNLYSRQIGAYGMETMNRITKLRIFIQGVKGVKFFVYFF